MPARRHGARGRNKGDSRIVGQVDDQLSVPALTFYTVKKGDTLSKISKQFYGDANAYKKIFDANRDQLKDPDKIQPGQVLRIPS